MVKPTKEVNELLKSYGTSPLSTGSKMSELLKRTEITYEILEPIDDSRPKLNLQEKDCVPIILSL